MATPKDILAVKRPKGTVVKTVGKHHYVYSRTSKYVNGRRVPVDKERVGKIIDYKFVPTKKKVKNESVEIKDYANVEFADNIAKGVLDELLKVYSENDALKIYCIALIRVLYGDVKNRDLKYRYMTSFVSEKYKVGLSSGIVSKFLFDLGKTPSRVDEFINNRISSSNGSIVVDGMLKNYNGDTSLARWSRKGSVKGSKDISILYALDISTNEPIGFAVNQGNLLDVRAFENFANKYDLTKGVVIGDKGFQMHEELRNKILDNKELRYLIPIKRNSKVIKDNKLLECKEVLHNIESTNILAKKTKVNDTFYYSFIDIKKQSSEFNSRLDRQIKKELYIDKILDNKESYGSIVFESNIDEELDTVYAMYKERWEIEILFNFYKNIVELNNGNVHDDYKILGQEFINFITVIIAIKLKKKIIELKLNEKYSFKQIKMYLQGVKKTKVANSEEWIISKNLKYVDELMMKLEIGV